MNIFAAFLKSSEVSTWGGMYMPAMEGSVASRFIDRRYSAAWFIPRPIFLVWSTSVRTPSASRRLPSASWSAAACMLAIFCCTPAVLLPTARKPLLTVANSAVRFCTPACMPCTAGCVVRPLNIGPAAATTLLASVETDPFASPRMFSRRLAAAPSGCCTWFSVAVS